MNERKEKCRKECFRLLSCGSQHNKLYRDALVNKQLESIFADTKGLKILFYWPLGIEANILKAIKKIGKKNKLYLPFMQDVSFKIVPFRLPLSRKKFNIYEANNSIMNIKNIDVAIVPIIGVDKHARRIGFGKGMYDRFFETIKDKPYTIFVQSKLCYVADDVCDDFDISCDILLAPRKTLLHMRKKNVNNNIIRSFNGNYCRLSRFFGFKKIL